MPLKAGYYTLGCKLNFSETSTIADLLAGQGVGKISVNETPDICIVNTCSVTSNADKKGRHLIRNLASKYPDAAIIVTGCYAQLKPEEVAALPGVVLVLGSDEKLKITQYISRILKTGSPMIEVKATKEITEFIPSCQRGDRTRYFLKVQDGCNYYCTYCTIPYARGKSRSGSISSLVDLAKEAASKGGKEIVLTGVNIGTFGVDHGEDFLSLLKALEEVEGIERYRISSIEPNLLTDEIISWIALESKKFMPHFHIPLQSGSDKVLKMMGRRYETALFSSRISMIHKMIPDAFIGVDVIAGARGETREEWEKSLSYYRVLDVNKFHAFPYSEREGTRALSLGEPVDQGERYKRVESLNKISEQKTKDFIESNIGKIKKVLWEKVSGKGLMQGLTENYIRVEAPYLSDFINNITEVKLTGLKTGTSDMAIGEHVEK